MQAPARTARGTPHSGSCSLRPMSVMLPRFRRMSARSPNIISVVQGHADIARHVGWGDKIASNLSIHGKMSLCSPPVEAHLLPQGRSLTLGCC